VVLVLENLGKEHTLLLYLEIQMVVKEEMVDQVALLVVYDIMEVEEEALLILTQEEPEDLVEEVMVDKELLVQLSLLLLEHLIPVVVEEVVQIILVPQEGLV
jgi:hypothetical protein